MGRGAAEVDGMTHSSISIPNIAAVEEAAVQGCFVGDRAAAGAAARDDGVAGGGDDVVAAFVGAGWSSTASVTYN